MRNFLGRDHKDEKLKRKVEEPSRPPLGEIRVIVGGTSTGQSSKSRKTYLKVVQNVQLSGRPPRTRGVDEENEEQLCLNLDLIDEVRMDVEQRTARYKNLMVRQYDAMVKPRCFNIEDLVLKRVSSATINPAHGKLGPNLEGPYRVVNCKRQGSYYLEALDGQKLEHPWNVEHRRR